MTQSIEKGNVEIFLSYPPSYTAYRTSFKYSCDRNYVLSTPHSDIVCGADGWSNPVDQPRCLKGTCFNFVKIKS